MLDGDGKGESKLDNSLLLDNGLCLVLRGLAWVLDGLCLKGVGACAASVTPVAKGAE